MICHGQRGELRNRYREGQEDQLGALGLVVNAVVLWNTVYMQNALDHLKQNGMPTTVWSTGSTNHSSSPKLLHTTDYLQSLLAIVADARDCQCPD